MIKETKERDIRIWIFNNPIRGITEQLDYLVMVLRQHGYNVSISNRASPTALNILIENLDHHTLPAVLDFNRQYGKRLAVVMTEHIDYIDDKILFHGLPLSTPSEYMHALTRRSRLLHLMLAKDCIRFFIRLGDLPSLKGIDEMFCDVPVVTLPYPEINATSRLLPDDHPHEYDFAFSGFITEYRKQVLQRLQQKHSVIFPNKYISRRCRDGFNSQAKFVLNIPQDQEWPWISSMRIMAAWRCGRAVINIGKGLEGSLADYCLNIDVDTELDQLMEYTTNYQEIFEQQLAGYNQYVDSDINGTFPLSEFQTWDLVEPITIDS